MQWHKQSRAAWISKEHCTAHTLRKIAKFVEMLDIIANYRRKLGMMTNHNKQLKLKSLV
jgi:hypothetical protein